MIHPDTKLVTIDPVVGHGVVATRRLPRGTITWVMDHLDRVFTEADTQALPPRYQELFDHWTFHDGRGGHVLCWDIGRYMNHSCAASCGGSELGFEVALRDIEAGEELTNDYATMYMRPRERFDCRCGARSCRLVVSNAATHEAVAAMRHQVRRAIVGLDLVEQPLLALLRRDTLTWATEELDRAVERDVAVPMSRPPA